MRNREYVNEWEGYDVNVKGGYEEKRDKFYQAWIWWGLFILLFGIFISIVVHHAEECIIIYTYNSIEAEYINDEKTKVRFYDENGKEHALYLTGDDLVKRNGNVLVFYKDLISEGDFVHTGARWIPFYLFYGVLSIATGSRLWLIYCRKKHAVEKIDEIEKE